jgi:L-alanine-DL-glutamate epimerase-like enolase superfamily enzyme
MKITKIETLLLSRMHEPERQWVTSRFRVVKADCPIVVLHTDEGLTGIGEACAYGVPRLIGEWVDWLSSELVGQDPTNPRIVPHPNGRSWAHDCAVAGIDCALWDLKGQIEGKRVAELLTDKPLERVRLYASSGCRYDWRGRPEQLIDEALEYISLGYTAMKFRIGTEWSWDGVTVDRFLGLVRELAKTVAGRMELMLDGNQRLTVDQALPIAHELDRLGFKWFEEPIPQTDIDGYARLNAAVDLPITGGEQWTTVEQFRPYLERRAYAIVQPDAGWCGITELMRIAEMAHHYGVDCCPHSWHNGLMCMENAHAVAALPNPKVLELCMIQGPLQWEIFAEQPTIRDGWLELPQRPGLGVQLADGLAERFPYIEGDYLIQVTR